MATDPFEEAFRTELDAVIAANTGMWARKEVTNAYASADGVTSFIALEFGGGSERQFTFGAPGSNMWDARGQVLIRLVTPVNAGRDPVDGYAHALRSAFRNRRFTTTEGVAIRTNSGPPDSFEDGARWVKTVPVAYRTMPIA